MVEVLTLVATNKVNFKMIDTYFIPPRASWRSGHAGVLATVNLPLLCRMPVGCPPFFIAVGEVVRELALGRSSRLAATNKVNFK